MKTKNAFAFRDFDTERILQRPFFRDFYFEPNKSDEEILQSLSETIEDSVDSWEKNLYTIKAIHDRLEKFRQLINRHNEKRLDKYNKKKSISERIKITELQSPAPVMEYFSASLSVLELINKFKKLYREIDKKLQVRYRKNFAIKLKQIRQDLGLTQKQFGDLIQTSSQVFSLYERGAHDIPVHAIIRIAKALNMSSDQLLGLK
ncbi:MAG: helix-turn-helix transcriptional regulator [Selenomonadaceae bacterium]|nr:helix-turn-helix transcriptional regulator [Selenomonadaceae bacterium]